jgi:hypothetical protein
MLYMRQAWDENHPLLLDLSQDATPPGRARLHLFLLRLRSGESR